MGAFETLDVDGSTARLYVSGRFEPVPPGVLVLHAWWGLNDDVVSYADRLAAAEFAVTAPGHDRRRGRVEDRGRGEAVRAAESPEDEGGRRHRVCCR